MNNGRIFRFRRFSCFLKRFSEDMRYAVHWRNVPHKHCRITIVLLFYGKRQKHASDRCCVDCYATHVFFNNIDQTAS